MPLATAKPLAAGTHLWFALEGATLTIPASVVKVAGDASSYTTVQRHARPIISGSTIDGAWVKIGPGPTNGSSCVVETQIDNGQALEVWDAVPGGLALTDNLRVGRKRTKKATCKRIQPLTFQLLYSTLALNGSSTVFNPGAAPAEVNGWLHWQEYDHRNNLVDEGDIFAEVVLADALKSDPKAISDVVYLFTELHSLLNVGTL